MTKIFIETQNLKKSYQHLNGDITLFNNLVSQTEISQLFVLNKIILELLVQLQLEKEINFILKNIYLKV